MSSDSRAYNMDMYDAGFKLVHTNANCPGFSALRTPAASFGFALNDNVQMDMLLTVTGLDRFSLEHVQIFLDDVQLQDLVRSQNTGIVLPKLAAWEPRTAAGAEWHDGDSKPPKMVGLFKHDFERARLIMHSLFAGKLNGWSTPAPLA